MIGSFLDTLTALILLFSMSYISFGLGNKILKSFRLDLNKTENLCLSGDLAPEN